MEWLVLMSMGVFNRGDGRGDGSKCVVTIKVGFLVFQFVFPILRPQILLPTAAIGEYRMVVDVIVVEIQILVSINVGLHICICTWICILIFINPHILVIVNIIRILMPLGTVSHSAAQITHEHVSVNKTNA